MRKGRKHARTAGSLVIGASTHPDAVPKIPLSMRCATYIGLLILILVGRIEDLLGQWIQPKKFERLVTRDGYAPLLSDFDSFYARRIKSRVNDCFSRPSTGVPGRFIDLVVQSDGDEGLRKSKKNCLNLGSYNYLGYSEALGKRTCTVEVSIRSIGISFGGRQSDYRCELLESVEQQVASFIGKPAAFVCSMGFNANVCAIEALADPGSLIVSDELNHASIRYAARCTGARIATFKHNDVWDLESVLRKQMSECRPSKILVIVEGLYSMEGTICDLPGVLELKSRYRFALFIDEAHSVGSLGKKGRGVCDHFDVDPAKVDVLMGTFSKAFGAVGGYVAASVDVVRAIRSATSATMSELPSPAVLAQISACLLGFQSPDCQARFHRLARNTAMLRKGLRDFGFTVYGDDASPVVPLILYSVGKMAAFSRAMLEKGIAVVVVAYPATSFHTARARLCVSAVHTEADIETVLTACDELGDRLLIRYDR
jgi:serine palmitoyltransferase